MMDGPTARVCPPPIRLAALDPKSSSAKLWHLPPPWPLPC